MILNDVVNVFISTFEQSDYFDKLNIENGINHNVLTYTCMNNDHEAAVSSLQPFFFKKKGAFYFQR